MRIAMIGGGYVGLVSSACFAEFGIDVAVVEVDRDKLVAENVAAHRLTFTGDLNSAVRDAEAVFIAVGTPTRRGDGHADLSYVFAAAEQVAMALSEYSVIIT